MAEQPVPQLRLEPGAFWGHDAAGICNGHQVGDANRVHGEGDGRTAFVHEPGEGTRAADPPHEVDALVLTYVADLQHRREHLLVETRNVEAISRRGAGCGRPQRQRMPLTREVQRDLSRPSWRVAAAADAHAALKRL